MKNPTSKLGMNCVWNWGRSSSYSNQREGVQSTGDYGQKEQIRWNHQKVSKLITSGVVRRIKRYGQLGADYTESFQHGLSFGLLKRVGIVSRLHGNIQPRLIWNLSSSPGWDFSRGWNNEIWKWSNSATFRRLKFAQIIIALVWDRLLCSENKLNEVKHENTVKRCVGNNFSTGKSDCMTNSTSAVY